jgi:hypothetical protein
MSSNDIKFGFPAVMCLALGTFAPVLSLAEIDPALIVTPPPGLEAGYVPIVSRQAAKD